MHTRKPKQLVILAAVVFGFLAVTANSTAQDSRSLATPAIPRTWDKEAMQSLELPLADSAASPTPISADYYYAMPVRPIYKSYPIYRPDREPPAYLEALKQ